MEEIKDKVGEAMKMGICEKCYEDGYEKGRRDILKELLKEKLCCSMDKTLGIKDNDECHYAHKIIKKKLKREEKLGEKAYTQGKADKTIEIYHKFSELVLNNKHKPKEKEFGRWFANEFRKAKGLELIKWEDVLQKK